MANRDGIVSGFFTATLHALLALCVLFFARRGESPYTSLIVVASVVMLVCSVGLIARSHFSCLLLLLLDVIVIVAAACWCGQLIVALRALSDPAAGGISQLLDKIGLFASLIAAALGALLGAWLALRAYRLERRLRLGRMRMRSG